MEEDLSPLPQRMSMTFGNDSFVIRKACLDDLAAIKNLADQHKSELGFIVRGALQKSIEQEQLFVALVDDGIVCGFVQYRHRRDVQTTLYNLVVAKANRHKGIARALVFALETEARSLSQEYILLKSPSELLANEFYSKYGFSLVEIDKGKHRALNIWKLYLR